MRLAVVERGGSEGNGGVLPRVPRSGSHEEQEEIREGMGEVEWSMVADGTGGGKVAGFAFATTYTDEREDAVQGVGWVPGEATSDRAELGGIVQMMWEAKRYVSKAMHEGRTVEKVRLTSDCEGALKAVRWVKTAATGDLLKHKNRALLLECKWLWEHMEAEVELTWLPSHTGRKVHPFPIHDWCDESAPLAHSLGDHEGEEAKVSAMDAPFALWDSETESVIWRGWGDEIIERTKVRLTAAARRGGGAAGWMRLRARWFRGKTEWEQRPLGAKHTSGAKARMGALWDTVWGPGRWDREEKARRRDELHELRSSCVLCDEEFVGGWEEHMGECGMTEEARAFADGKIACEWVRQVAWDLREGQELWGRWRLTWKRMERGEEWRGFSMARVRMPMAQRAKKTGVGTQEGDPAVFTLEEKAAATSARQQQGKAEERQESREVWVTVARNAAGVQVVPAILFQLAERWQMVGMDAESFGEAVTEVVRRETERGERELDGMAVAQDFWAWPGCFGAWMERQAEARSE